MYTAKLISKKMSNTGSVTVVIEYSNGTEVFTETYAGSIDIKSTVLSKIKQLESTKTYFDSIEENKEIDPTVVPPVVTPPTQAEIDASNYKEKLDNLIVLKRDLDLGLITKTEYDIALAEVKLLKSKL